MGWVMDGHGWVMTWIQNKESETLTGQLHYPFGDGFKFHIYGFVTSAHKGAKESEYETRRFVSLLFN